MKIATFNLRNLFDAGHRDGYGNTQLLVTQEFVSKVVSNLSKVISSISPDILLAQEVGSEKVFKDLAKIVNPATQTFVAKPDPRGMGNAAMFGVVATCASIPDASGFAVFTLGEEDLIGAYTPPYRDLLYLKTTYNNLPLHVFGVHLKASTPSPLRGADGEKLNPVDQSDAGDGLIRANLYKLAEARRLRKLADELFLENANAQIIILGDFNDASDTAVLAIINGVLWKNTETQLTDVCEKVPEEKRYSFMGHGSKRLIDHILLSPALLPSVSNVEILNDTLIDQSTLPEDHYFTSDHAPVVLTLR